MQICQAPNFASEEVLIWNFFWKFTKIRSHFWLDFRGHIFFCEVHVLGIRKINTFLGTYFFFCVVLVWEIRNINEGHIFFSVRSLCGTYFLSRFSVKALCARFARYARSAPRPAFGRPWRALRWEKNQTYNLQEKFYIDTVMLNEY